MATTPQAPINDNSGRMFDGPIPGENYTSDTRNYPWHRPPEYTDLNKAIEKAAKKLTSPKGSMGLLTMMANGMDVSHLTYAFLMSGVGQGKWTVDYALLMAGPIAKIMCLMAKADGIEYDLGVNNDYKGPTKAFFTALKKINKDKAESSGEKIAQKLASDTTETIPSEPSMNSGFMAGPPVKEEKGQE